MLFDMANEADNVSDGVQLVAADTAVQVMPLEPPAHVRIGGQPGLRVQHQGQVMQVKRVTAGNDETFATTLPRETVETIKRTLDAKDMTDAVKLTAVRELLSPHF